MRSFHFEILPSNGFTLHILFVAERFFLPEEAT